MGKGRKSLPAELKVLRGTDQPCRMREQVSFSKVIELPRSGLKGTAKKIFQVTTTELINLNILDLVGVDLLISYSREMGMYVDLMNQVETEGYIIQEVGKFGVKQVVNPKRKVAETALSNAKAIASEYGFTPASRAKIAAMITDKPKGNEFDQFEEL